MMWRKVTLGEVCTLLNGRAYKKTELLDKGKYPVLRVGNFFTNRSWYYSDLELNADKYCDDGDLLYAWSASFGPQIWQGGKVIYHYHIWKTLIDQSRANKKFLYYWFLWDVDRIKAEQGAGTTMVHVTKRSMEDRSLNLPPLPEQKRIVAILDEAFEGIDTAIANTQANLAAARELFDSYLDDVLRKKGEGWVETPVGQFAQTQYGISGKMSVTEGNYKIFRMGEVQNGLLIDTGKMKFINADDETFEKYRLHHEDILFNRTNSIEHVGKTGIFYGDGDYLFASYLVRLQVDAAKINNRFLCYLMNSRAFLRDIRKKASKSVNQANINATILRNELISYPKDVQTQREIADRLSTLEAHTRDLEDILQQKLDALHELKQSILAKAFRGELTQEEIAA